MNILLLSTHLNAGGITSYLYTTAKGLIQRGHQVHVATSGGNMDEAFKSIGATLQTYDIKTKSELDPRIYLSLKPLVRYISGNNIALVHAHTRITQVMAQSIQKKCGCAMVTTCHGFFKPRLGRRLNPCWGDAVIAISQPVVNHLINDFHVPHTQIELIQSGIDVDAYHVVDESVKLEQRARFDLGQRPIIGNVARLSDVKGPDILIEAMQSVIKSIPECMLLLIGDGRMKNKLHSQVKRLDLVDRVRFLSVVNRTSEMLSLFDIFVMPSRQEGLGLSIMEAQASGLPVVASRVGGIPSIVKDGHTGILVEPQNPESLAKAIVQLYNDKDQLNKIATAGRDSVVKNHSAEQMVNKTEKLYKRLVA